jgi:OPA family glycerol-3-phosphate transporter-like MFS transporter
VISVEARRGHLRKWRTLTLALLVVGYTGYYLCRSNLSVCMPLIIDEMSTRGANANAVRVMLGSIASLGVLAYAIGKFPSGSLADFFGGRRNFLSGMAGSVVFTILFAASGSPPIFTLAWIGNRFVQSLGWAGAVKIASKWFPFRGYGTVMAIVSLSYLFGDALARQFMGLLIARGLGWREVFGATAVVLAALFAICSLLLRESPSDIGEAPPSVNPANLFGNDGSLGSPKSLHSLLAPLLRSRVFWIACVLSLGTTILRETFGLWTPTYFTQATGMTAAEAAGNSALFPFFGGISVITCGWLSDRLGRGGRAALMLGGLILAGIALLVLGSSPIHSRISSLTLVAMVAFLTIGPYSFLGGAISLDLGGKQGSGTTSGIIDGIGYLGGVLSGDSMARISVDFGWSGAFLVLAVIAFLSSIAAWAFLGRERSLVRELSASGA